LLSRAPADFWANGQDQKPNSAAGNSALVHDAAALLQAGRLEEAEAIARRAVAAQPDAGARAVLGAVLDQRGLTQEAEKEYREALQLDARSTVALTNLGVLLARTGRGDERSLLSSRYFGWLPITPRRRLTSARSTRRAKTTGERFRSLNALRASIRSRAEPATILLCW